ncbi:WYL domain-containing protein [Ectopseudomonas mendocina]|uniref:WYL domain-containing protein n=1 Tax=Ectopseudomonas mendocina TaxID=300 RepID=A0ABD7RMH2_ECTME|nr:WYL domain-containing protein [Pseudomonas mendocina]TRO06362.1 WYL domain-containing protein [Pseudomonas mendocina]TRO10089.1 WYL domain-containing protein [Pseudomonas mendocina]
MFMLILFLCVRTISHIISMLNEQKLSQQTNQLFLHNKDWMNVKASSLVLSGHRFVDWLLSQGEHLEVLEPIELREQIATSAKRMAALYEKS